MNNNAIQNKYTFVFFVSVKNGLFNSDPDTDGMPRLLPNGKALATDVAAKRRIRDYVLEAKGEKKGYQIYQKSGNVLSVCEGKAFESLGLNADKADVKKRKGSNPDINEAARRWMCAEYWDVRTFGGVLTSFTKNGLDGQISGPVRITNGESIDPVDPQVLTITRGTLTTPEEAMDKNNTMGSKVMVPYALYRFNCEIYPSNAKKTGFDDEDLELLWKAILNMFEVNPSASIGETYVARLYVFKHESFLGNAPKQDLYNAIQVKKKPGVVTAYDFDDYEITVDEASLPSGITLTVM